MNTSEIQEWLQRINERLAEKGVKTPDSQIEVHADSFKGWLTGKDVDPGHSIPGAKGFYGSLEEIIFKIETHIAEFPSKEERERQQYRRKLADLLDYGQEIGIEPEFENPLRKMMEKLSENIIEDHTASYEIKDDLAS